MVVVRLPVVLLVLVVVQALTEGIVSEFSPFTVIDVFTLSSKVRRVKDLIHKVPSQDVVAL